MYFIETLQNPLCLQSFGPMPEPTGLVLLRPPKGSEAQRVPWPISVRTFCPRTEEQLREMLRFLGTWEKPGGAYSGWF